MGEDERKFLASSSQALFVLRFAFLGITFFVSESRLFLHDKLGRAITRSFCERIWSRSTIFDRALPLHCERAERRVRKKKERSKHGSYAQQRKRYELQRSSLQEKCPNLVEGHCSGSHREHLQAREEGTHPFSDRRHSS